MNLNLNNKNVDELKLLLKKHDLVANVSTLKKDDLVKNLRAVQKYKDKKEIGTDDYKTFYFGDKKIVLNDEQHKVVTSKIDQNIRVIAAAGSGKTTIYCA